MPRDWLSAELALKLSESLDFKTYVRLLAVNRTIRAALDPKRAELVFPHALEHMAALIKAERMRVVDPAFNFDCVMGQYSLSFKSNCGVFATTFGVQAKQFKDRAETRAVLLLVCRDRVVALSDGISTRRVRIELARATLFPSPAEPFLKGRVDLAAYAKDRDGLLVKQFENTVHYAEGFDAFLRALACDLCPLRPEFTAAAV
jgi:hypothetical protein